MIYFFFCIKFYRIFIKKRNIQIQEFFLTENGLKNIEIFKINFFFLNLYPEFLENLWLPKCTWAKEYELVDLRFRSNGMADTYT